MDGIPAPVSSLVDKKDAALARKAVYKVMLNDWMNYTGEEKCKGLWSRDMVWYGPVGIGMATTCKEYHEHFLRPLHSAFKQSTLEIDVFTCEGPYCGVHGRFYGQHVGEWLGEKPTHKWINLRFGMHYHVDMRTHEVYESWALFDIPDAFNQMGVNLYDRVQDDMHAHAHTHTAN